MPKRQMSGDKAPHIHNLGTRWKINQPDWKQNYLQIWFSWFWSCVLLEIITVSTL